jgi:hypothetical protein
VIHRDFCDLFGDLSEKEVWIFLKADAGRPFARTASWWMFPFLEEFYLHMPLLSMK